MAGAAILSAISIILYIFVKFNLPFFPSFLDIQVSEIPALIAGFAYGPFWGFVVILIRAVVKLPLSSTAMVGELADFVIGVALVVPASLIYSKKRNVKGALLGFGISAIFSTGVAMLMNDFVLIPFYLKLFFNGNWAPLLGMCSMIKGITQETFMVKYLFVGVLPFNLFRYVIVGIFTFLLYKRINKLLDKIKPEDEEKHKFNWFRFGTLFALIVELGAAFIAIYKTGKDGIAHGIISSSVLFALTLLMMIIYIILIAKKKEISGGFMVLVAAVNPIAALVLLIESKVNKAKASKEEPTETE